MILPRKTTYYFLFILSAFMTLYVIHSIYFKTLSLKGSDSYAATSSKKFIVERVAHAGGSYKGMTYTNSLEALEYNSNRGFIYFEIDLLFTRDGHLVCGHNWGDDFGYFDWQDEAPTLKEFIEITKANNKFTRCTLSSLEKWLQENNLAKIITDIKSDDALAALNYISTNHASMVAQIIPQIYLPEQFIPARKMGFESIIWTLYRYRATIFEVITIIEDFEPPFAMAVSIDRDRAIPLGKILVERNVPVYIHTINDIETKHRLLREKIATEIYTDFLHPASP